MTDETQGSGFSWFLLGLGVGAALGVLYAPKPGTETREDLITGARESTEYLRQKSQQAADQVNTYVDKGKQYVDRGREQWGTYVDKGRQAVTEQTSKVSQAVNEQTSKVQAAVEAGKQAYQRTTTENPS